MHLTNLAEKYARENKLKNKTAVQELLAHESIRTTFELLRGKLKNNVRGQLDKVWIAVDESGNYVKDTSKKKVVEDTEELHKHLLKRNRKQLSQAKYTPFTKGIPWPKL